MPVFPPPLLWFRSVFSYLAQLAAAAAQKWRQFSTDGFRVAADGSSVSIRSNDIRLHTLLSQNLLEFRSWTRLSVMLFLAFFRQRALTRLLCAESKCLNCANGRCAKAELRPHCSFSSARAPAPPWPTSVAAGHFTANHKQQADRPSSGASMRPYPQVISLTRGIIARSLG